jgi:hypothetical protein
MLNPLGGNVDLSLSPVEMTKLSSKEFRTMINIFGLDVFQVIEKEDRGPLIALPINEYIEPMEGLSGLHMLW